MPDRGYNYPKMGFQWTPYAGILFATASLLLLVLGVILPYRRMPGGIPLVLLLLSCALWALLSGLEGAAVGQAHKIFFSKLFYLASVPAPPLMLVFALAYRRRQEELTPANLAMIFAPAPIFVLLAWTNELHGLIWTGFSPGPIPGSNILVYHHGVGFWFVSLYGVVCSALAIYHLGRLFLKSHGPYRRQLGALVVGLIFPWVGSCLYIFDLGALAGIDLVAVSFSLTAAALAWGVLRQHMFDLLPIARDILIESMEDGVLVLDSQDRIIDVNLAARHMLSIHSPIIGEPLSNGLADWPDLVHHLNRIQQGEQDVLVGGQAPFYLDLHVVPVHSSPENLSGRLVTLRDVTDRRKLQEELEHKSLEMERLSVTDWLTQFYNRRYAEQALTAEFNRAARYGGPLAIGLFDLDLFKQVNDRYGHAAGDQVIRSVADQLRACIRTVDVAARFGGEEFLIIFPNTSLQDAYQALERLRNNLATCLVQGVDEPVTLSGGVTAWFAGDQPGEALKRADRLLYRAKNGGRNQIVVDG